MMLLFVGSMLLLGVLRNLIFANKEWNVNTFNKRSFMFITIIVAECFN